MPTLETAAGNGQVYVDKLSPTGSESTESFNTYYDFFSTEPLPEYARFLSEESGASDVHSAQVYVRLGPSGERIDLNSIADTSFASNSSSQAVSNPFSISQNSQTLDVNLTQTLTDIESEGVRIGGQLAQVYTFSNPTDSEVYIEFFRTADIDVNGSGSLEDDGGGFQTIDGLDWIFETDTTVDTKTETELIAIRIEGGSDIPEGSYGFDEYDEVTETNPLSTRVASGDNLLNNVLGDDDEDKLVDVGNGKDLALARGKFLRIAPGQSDSLIVFTAYGKLSVDQLTELTNTTLTLAPTASDILTVNSTSEDTQIKFSVDSNTTSKTVEIVAVITDDAEGSIEGISIGEEGYAEAELSRSKTIFSVLSEKSIESLDIERILDVSNDKFINFKVLQDGGLGDLINSTIPVSALSGAKLGNADGLSGIQYTPLSNDSYQLNFRMPEGDNSFESIQITATLGNFEQALGANVQGQNSDSELIDLRDITTPTVTATFDVYREALFSNVVGFYTVENEAGQVFNENDELLYPGDEGYIRAALNNRIDVALSSTNGQHATYTAEVETGQLLATFITRDQSFADILSNTGADNPVVFFSYAGANTDGADHVRLLGSNTFGFEDMVGGGDLDFDDLVVKTTIS